MKTNKLMLLLALAVGFFSARGAMAEIAEPQEYITLTAVELAPEQTPRLNAGLSDLSGAESKYQEKLPLQLAGALDKVKKAKYKRRR